jgi:ABC-type phosphate/phosphonate transport system substrate-binding protein
MKMIAEGIATVAAIDSTVYDIEVANDPTLADRFRLIDALGPMPIPPYVIGRWVPAATRQTLREALVGMDRSATGRAILQRYGYRRFHPVTDGDYDLIRETQRVGAVNLPLSVH